jgi:hypothetical protein
VTEAASAPHEFSIDILDGQGQGLVLPLLLNTYVLPFGVKYRFVIVGENWEEWNWQLQESRQSFGPVHLHNA